MSSQKEKKIRIKVAGPDGQTVSVDAVEVQADGDRILLEFTCPRTGSMKRNWKKGSAPTERPQMIAPGAPAPEPEEAAEPATEG